jgi:hypothetical protein
MAQFLFVKESEVSHKIALKILNEISIFQLSNHQKELQKTDSQRSKNQRNL